MTHVSSATPLCRAIVRLISREWLVALVGRDVLSEKSVKAEATGLLRSWPRVRQRIGTSSEASHVGPRASRRIGTPFEALRAGLERDGESVPRPRHYEPTSSETENRYPIRGLTCGASSEAENLFEVGWTVQPSLGQGGG